MDTRIYVMTHKQTSLPSGADELIYIPLQVGKSISIDLGYQGDDEGDNISDKNKSFCELTGQYWLWKNVTCDYIGIAHYRRFMFRDS